MYSSICLRVVEFKIMMMEGEVIESSFKFSALEVSWWCKHCVSATRYLLMQMPLTCSHCEYLHSPQNTDFYPHVHTHKLSCLCVCGERDRVRTISYPLSVSWFFSVILSSHSLPISHCWYISLSIFSISPCSSVSLSNEVSEGRSLWLTSPGGLGVTQTHVYKSMWRAVDKGPSLERC